MGKKEYSENRPGVVLADKPVGMGSATLVSRLKRELQARRVGHCGTLDRFASGLMVLVVGGATSLADYFLHQDKSYIATFRFGLFTDTHDPSGKILEERPATDVTEFLERNGDLIRTVVRDFREIREQTPPLYSAIKQEGKRLSDYARRGESREIQPRAVTIFAAEVLEISPHQGEVIARFHVSSGTYIRSLARDLSLALPFPLHLSALRRITLGEFSLDDRVWVPGRGSPILMDPRAALPGWREERLANAEMAKMVLQGQHPAFENPPAAGIDFFISGPDGSLLAWAVGDAEGYHYRRVFL